jgi:two-component sensor histidine kinase
LYRLARNFPFGNAAGTWQPSIGSVRALSAAAIVLVFIGDCVTPADYVVGIFYLLAMAVAAHARSRTWLSGVGIAALALTLLAAVVGAAPLPGTPPGTMWANRGLTIVALLGLLLILHRTLSMQAKQEQLRHEVDHRAKNILAAVSALLHLVPRNDAARFAAMVEERVHAMARVHSLLAEERWEGADLRSLAQRELAPYAGPPSDRTRLDGPAVRLDAVVAQPLGLVLHELAANAARHGALSVPAGRLSLRWHVDPATTDLLLEWTEMDGPPVERPPERRGFGTRLMAGLARQIGGGMENSWHPTGLHCLIRVPRRNQGQAR